MPAGKRGNLVIIQQLTDGQDEIGQPTQVWAELAQEWADIRYQSGLEAIKADAPVSIVKASIRIPYRTDINAQMRVLLGSTVYSIKTVLPDVAKRKHIDLTCEVING